MKTGLTKSQKTTEIWFDEKRNADLYPHPQHRPQEQADRIQPPLPGDLQADRRGRRNRLHGV